MGSSRASVALLANIVGWSACAQSYSWRAVVTSGAIVTFLSHSSARAELASATRHAVSNLLVARDTRVSSNRASSGGVRASRTIVPLWTDVLSRNCGTSFASS